MPPGIQSHTLLTFILQLALLLTAARTLGEIARRLGQPPVIGELLAGVLLGPSVLGALAPELQIALFPRDPLQFQLLEIVAWLGMIWLLLMTGLETDLDTLRNLGRAAFYASLLGMVVPFATAFALGWALPDRLLVAPHERLIFALFLGTALCVSAIPVIARILTDLDLMRRNVGIVILGAGVTDDTTGWLLLSVIAGIATRGELSVSSAALAIASTAAFVALVWLAGARAVYALLQWIDDRVELRHAMVSAVIVIALFFGAVTEAIGIHAVFGAFVAGIVIGRSPRLRKGVLEQIEAPLLAVLAPIFFAYAGLKVDFVHGFEVATTLAVITVACAGKLLGASVGAYWGGLGFWESLAIGSGMNARGAIGLIIALVGLSLGILSAPMYAAIVTVAIFTSAIAGPLLRWTARHIPVAPDEVERFRRHAERARALLPTAGLKVLLPTSGGQNAARAMELVAPIVAGDSAASVVAFHVDAAPRRFFGGPSRRRTPIAAHLDELDRLARAAGAPALTRKTECGEPVAEVILREAARGYDLIVLGASEAARRHPLGGEYVRAIAAAAPCPLLVVRSGPSERHLPGPVGTSTAPPLILLPVRDGPYARAAVELAMLYAVRVGGIVNAVHVIESSFAIFGRARAAEIRAEATVAIEGMFADVRQRGSDLGIPVATDIIEAPNVERALLRAARDADLLVLRAATRPHARRTFFGLRVEAVLADAPCPVAVLLLPA
ncbi:MAG: cation:proton antiporter [Myxococcales bacterium]|jgi:Kef-type K+ transport system membrane component KefB/nucleotide-binding universal stress UspA family protein|nr:cation:proton antiporter [Myxococcales bacterium]